MDNQNYTRITHFEHFLKVALNDKTPKMTKELENKLKFMFSKVELVFDKHKNPGRKNFLSYMYVTNKLLRIIGRTENQALEFVPLFEIPFRFSENVLSHDKMWKDITFELGWVYDSSDKSL